MPPRALSSRPPSGAAPRRPYCGPGLWAALALAAALICAGGCKTGRLGMAVNATLPIFSGDAGLSEATIVDGLKEALRVGADRAVSTVSRPGGYLERPEIRIPLPPELREAEDLIRGAGLGRMADDFEASMNRAAEEAAPEARQVLWQAVRTMSIAEARSILRGPEDAATRYFQRETGGSLQERFRPLVSEALDRVGVTRTYQSLQVKLALLPGLDLSRFSLEDYVTGKALDGLFTMLAKEERAIREDPAARTTELLRRVFGRNSTS